MVEYGDNKYIYIKIVEYNYNEIVECRTINKCIVKHYVTKVNLNIKLNELIEMEMNINLNELIEMEMNINLNELIEMEMNINLNELIEMEMNINLNELIEMEMNIKLNELIEMEMNINLNELIEMEMNINLNELIETEMNINLNELIEMEMNINLNELIETEMNINLNDLIEIKMNIKMTMLIEIGGLSSTTSPSRSSSLMARPIPSSTTPGAIEIAINRITIEHMITYILATIASIVEYVSQCMIDHVIKYSSAVTIKSISNHTIIYNIAIMQSIHYESAS